MTTEAIALCRVSTPEQRLNNSLARQAESVEKAAKDLGVSIIRTWSGDASSKVGKNLNRKDLKEAFSFCKSNPQVKYLIVDEVDRFMRSIGEMFAWIVDFGEIGVRVYFASNPELNTGDAKSRLLLALDAFKAEGSNEERQHKSISGHEKAIHEGRYTFPPKPGYMKGTEPGVHVPNEEIYPYLQKAFRELASGLYTPTQVLRRLNNGDFAKAHGAWKMDKFRRFATDPYYAGVLAINRQVKASNAIGKHKAMISLDEHEQLIRIFNGSIKVRKARKQYNPEFPMNKLLTCAECEGEIKFTGSTKNNGKSKKRTRYYHLYRCRGCNGSYHRADVHEAITQILKQVELSPADRQAFLSALTQVWTDKQKDKLSIIDRLQKQLLKLNEDKSKLVMTLARIEVEYSADIKVELDRIKEDIKLLVIEIEQQSDIEKDFVDFVEFALSYADKLAKDWWQLDHEQRSRCQQLIFPGGISIDSNKKVSTPQLSPFYTLAANKKDPRIDRESLLVELAGIAPASVGLSWLVFYRLSLLENLRPYVSKQTKNVRQQSQILAHRLDGPA